MSQDRRDFLKAGAAAASLTALGACAPEAIDGAATSGSTRDLDDTLLRVVGEVVLPEELGGPGRERAVAGFQRWAAEYRAVPELNHGYGTSEIRYGPPDPVPAWRAQLQALELEATKRHRAGFAALEAPVRRSLLLRHVGNAGPGIPNPLRAEHVALALLSHWLSTPEATDLCYGRRISPRTCRGIEGAAAEPEALT